MKKMNVKKEILVIMMILIMLLGISTKVLATGDASSPIQIPVINTNAETTPNPTTNETTDANSTINPTTNVVTPTTNTTETTTYQNSTTLPQTGDASDYAIFLLIVVAVIIAVYAYRKVREYNI